MIAATHITRFADLARGSPLGRDAEGVLRLVNAMYPAGRPKPGRPLKVLV